MSNMFTYLLLFVAPFSISFLVIIISLGFLLQLSHLKSPEVFPTNQLRYIILILHIYSTAGELTLKEMKEKRMTKRKRIGRGKGKNTAKTSDSSIVVQHCKKSDGKGWHCRRPAQLPNSLCSYHLTQIRAYTSNHHRATDSSTAIADSGKPCDRNRHKKAAVHEEEAAGTDSSFYYYYEGFGPSRGKQRGKISAGCSSSSNVLSACDGKVKMKEDSSSKESSTILDNGGGDDDDDNNAIAGDDEYDLDCFDEDDGDVSYSTRKEHEEIDVGKIREEEVEKKRVVKKRGRKPFKCRSLKSLL